jgi:hypothetical protein
MKAPNGKPSNLTPEQWRLVRTPQFKAWFGDWENDPENASKVVDENGEPLVVYHGSRFEEGFYEFKHIQEEKLDWIKDGVGFYFSDNKKFAEGYGKKIYECFLNIRSPKISITFEHTYLPLYKFQNFINVGYDGIYFGGSVYGEKERPKEIVAFYSNQIKLADGTNTTFDGSNSDIRFAEGGKMKKKLLAPNGEPSNLTPKQWKLVRTPQFKAWFGDFENDPENASKVVDENGEPLVVYHGTNVPNITIFKESYDGGYWFTSDFRVAEDFAINNNFGGQPNIYTCFLSITNPYTTNLKGQFLEHSKDLVESIKYALENSDGIIIYNALDQIESGIASNIFNCFNPNQIKLADGTNTTFDGSNPDIRFSEGGLVEGKEYKGKLVKSILSKASFYNTDFFENIGDDDNYVFRKVDVNKLYSKDRTLADFVDTSKDDFQDNINDYRWELQHPIVVGDTDWEKGVVLDGYHRIAQTLANKGDKLYAFVKQPTNETDKYFHYQFAEGGEVNSNSFIKWFVQWYEPISNKVNIAFSFSNHLQPFKEKNVIILDVFEKIDQRVDAKKYLQEIVAKADEYGVVIYLEPKPRHKHFQDNLEKKEKISKDYLIGYYEKFGFELTPNKLFMKRKPSNPDIRFAEGGKTKRTMKRIKRGGITYGKSHAEGGIPVKNQSTGDMLEVEGGEGIVNKRSMASKSKVTLNGKEMNICQAVSELNQMEGGVKFSCEDVNDRQFIKAMAKGGELDRGTRTEQEHIQVLKDLYAKRITPKQASERIAKDHLKEDSRYYSKLAKMEGKMAKGGKVKNDYNVPSTEDLVEMVTKEKDRAIRRAHEDGIKVVIGRYDGYGATLSNGEYTETILATRPSRRKVIEIIESNPEVIEVYFLGTIKVADRVGEEMEYFDDFAITLWEKTIPIDVEKAIGITFQWTDTKPDPKNPDNDIRADEGIYMFVKQEDSHLYKDRPTDNTYLYVNSYYEKYGEQSSLRIPKKDIQKLEEQDAIEIVKVSQAMKENLLKPMKTYADGGKTRKNAKKTLSEAVGFDINSIDISKL